MLYRYNLLIEADSRIDTIAVGSVNEKKKKIWYISDKENTKIIYV